MSVHFVRKNRCGTFRVLRRIGISAILAGLFASTDVAAQDGAGSELAGSESDDAAVADTGEDGAEEKSQTDVELETKSGIKKDSSSSADDTIGLTLDDRIRAVSRKVFVKAGRFELLPFGGISTNDAFFQRWTAGARMSYHLMDSFSIDLGGAYSFWSWQLDPVRTVKQQLNAITDDAVFYGYGDLGFNFSPIYGKFALMSEWIIHFDAFVSGGLGTTFDSNQYTFLGDPLPGWMPGINPAAEIGIGTRIFLFPWLIFRLDLRDYAYPQYRGGISTLQNLLMLNVGLGFYFPFNFEYENTAARIVD
jgi:outer membrane beta-barrel protein